MTLWDLVLRNKRIVTQDEIEAKRKAAVESERRQEEPRIDDLSDLFDNTGQMDASQRNSEGDLFGTFYFLRH